MATTHSTLGDVELVRLAQGGDEEAFAQLVLRHTSLFHRVVQRILGDPGDTQDALQEALIAMHTQIRGFQGNSSFSTWGYRICVNKALMLRRSRIRRREDLLDEFMPRFASDGHHEDMQGPLDWSSQAEAHALAEASELRGKILEALDRLTDDQRQVFVLKDLEDWDSDEIARHLDISRELVRQRLHRARLALRGALAPFVTGRRR